MKVLKTLLLISLALNIFLGGIFLGEKFSQKPPLSLQDSPVETVLPSEQRDAYQSGMKQAKQRFQQGQKDFDALHGELMILLAAEQFDSTAYQALTEEMLAARTVPLETFLREVAATVEEMSVVERQAVAEDIGLRYEAYRQQKKCPQK